MIVISSNVAVLPAVTSRAPLNVAVPFEIIAPPVVRLFNVVVPVDVLTLPFKNFVV